MQEIHGRGTGEDNGDPPGPRKPNLLVIEKAIEGKLHEKLENYKEDKCKPLLVVKICKFTYGSTSEKENPLDHLIYKNTHGGNIENSKNCHAVCRALIVKSRIAMLGIKVMRPLLFLQSLLFLPQDIVEYSIRLYSRDRSNTECNEALRDVYKEWWAERLIEDAVVIVSLTTDQSCLFYFGFNGLG